MSPGKAFELLVKQILLHMGFSEIASDGLFIFDGPPEQMIQGLADAHNADVLLDPPVQTPFYTPTRLLIECKNYNKKVGLNTIRSALGLREDINHFDNILANTAWFSSFSFAAGTGVSNSVTGKYGSLGLFPDAPTWKPW